MRLTRVRLEMLAAVCLLLVIPSKTVLANDADPISAGNKLTQQLRAELDQKLNTPIEAKFDGIAVREAVMSIGEQIKADVVFGGSSIEEEGLTTDNPLTLAISHAKLPARQVLELMLRPEGLAAVNHNGVLFVTSRNHADEMLYIRVYDVRDLVEESAKTIELRPLPDCECPEVDGKNPSAVSSDAKKDTPTMAPQATSFRMLSWGTPDCRLSACLKYYGQPRDVARALLVDSIQLTTTGPWSKVDGVGGTIEAFDGRLVIKQTEENHAQIQQILDGLRSKAEARDGERNAAKESLESGDTAAEALPSY